MAYPSGPPPAPPAQSLGSTNTVFITETRFDLSYIVTPPGIIKAVLVVLNLLCFICIEASAFRSNGRGVYFVFVSLVGLALTGGLLLMYLYHLVEKYHNFKWLKVEMVGSAVLTFLNLIAATMAVAFGNPAYSAAGFFGYLAMVLYGVDAFLKAKALKAGELAQGSRVHTKQTHITTPPALP
ncbi:plasmolipin-like [Cydia amplana]|uniref:plasmolipin-like n=1 Tax=Cydia amplana TaxID=1869771 RepID=UPI002FE58223